MPFWFLFLIILILVIVLAFTLEGVIKEKKSTEVMMLGIVFILTGGIFLIEPSLLKSSFQTYIQLSFVLFGFLVAILGFFKQ